MSAETWKPIVDYEGHYEVSDLGNVRSMTRLANGKAYTVRDEYGKYATPDHFEEDF